MKALVIKTANKKTDKKKRDKYIVCVGKNF
jgi:hypothetical protein